MKHLLWVIMLFALPLSLTATSVSAQTNHGGALWPELVIPVDPTEARQVIESDPTDELRFEEFAWLSNGRIRIAKIDGDVLALVDQAVQFTAFEDAEPIIVVSQGIDGNTWRGSRINGRVEAADYGGLEAVVQANPEIDAAVLEQALAQLRTQHNEVTWRVRTSLQDPTSGEYLLRGQDLDKFVINPRTGRYQTIDALEKSARWLAEKDGLIAPCAPEVQAAQIRREQAARSLPAPPLPPPPGPALDSPPESASLGPRIARAGESAVFSRTEPAGCESLGDVFELAKSLSAESSTQWPYDEFQPGKPVPANAVTSYGASGAISSDRARPLGQEKPTNAHHYVIERLGNSPAYVVIYEPVRRLPAMAIDDYRSEEEIAAWQRSPEMVTYRKSERYRRANENKESLAAHMAVARARIEARAQPTGGVQ